MVQSHRKTVLTGVVLLSLLYLCGGCSQHRPQGQPEFLPHQPDRASFISEVSHLLDECVLALEELVGALN